MTGERCSRPRLMGRATAVRFPTHTGESDCLPFSIFRATCPLRLLLRFAGATLLRLSRPTTLRRAQ